MDLPKRKRNRLKYYDYSKPGAYFITVCTKDRKCILASSPSVGAGTARPQTEMALSPHGVLVDRAIKQIPDHYENVCVDTYVIMPNHIHLILVLLPLDDGRAMPAPTVSRIIQHLKGYVTKQIGQNIWQKLFYDHIIRNRESFGYIREYIVNNPKTWENDCFYERTTL